MELFLFSFSCQGHRCNKEAVQLNYVKGLLLCYLDSPLFYMSAEFPLLSLNSDLIKVQYQETSSRRVQISVQGDNCIFKLCTNYFSILSRAILAGEMFH